MLEQINQLITKISTTFDLVNIAYAKLIPVRTKMGQILQTFYKDPPLNFFIREGVDSDLQKLSLVQPHGTKYTEVFVMPGDQKIEKIECQPLNDCKNVHTPVLKIVSGGVGHNSVTIELEPDASLSKSWGCQVVVKGGSTRIYLDRYDYSDIWSRSLVLPSNIAGQKEQELLINVFKTQNPLSALLPNGYLPILKDFRSISVVENMTAANIGPNRMVQLFNECKFPFALDNTYSTHKKDSTEMNVSLITGGTKIPENNSEKATSLQVILKTPDLLNSKKNALASSIISNEEQFRSSTNSPGIGASNGIAPNVLTMGINNEVTAGIVCHSAKEKLLETLPVDMIKDDFAVFAKSHTQKGLTSTF